MKNTLIKTFLVYLALSGYLQIKAQNASVIDYFSHTKDHAVIFSGEIEQPYNSLFYKNTPYYINDEYVNGAVVYKKNHYPNVRMRFDLYKEHLIVLTPLKQHSKIVPTEDVDSVYIHNKIFFNHTPPEKSGLRPGYYMLLFDSGNIRLLGKAVFVTDFQKPEDKKSFSEKTNYYFVYKDEYHSVNNRNSFYKIFPAHKKQIKKYAKEEKLNFKAEKEKSLISLSRYCKALTN